jgi:general stress protein YciG
MDQEKQREIARKGGQAVSRDRQHMASIGGKGGEAVSRDREHMAAIGRKGGAARSAQFGDSGDGLDVGVRS